MTLAGHDYSTGGMVFAAVSAWGMSIVEWMRGAGFLTPTFAVAIIGTAIGFITNYRRLRESAPLFWADLKALYRSVRGKA